MNQSHALEHYHRLSKTFQFDVYFPRSQILAHKSSNAWDLPSLLIKPVQRLLHYPQLLAAIIAETPDAHPDKANLVEAQAQIGELARRLGAQWRQQKAVQEVLASTGAIDAPQGGGDVAKAGKKGGFRLGLAAAVSLGRIMNPRSVAVKAKEGPEASADSESEAVMAMGERLKSYKLFMMQIARDAVNWVREMGNLVGALEEWAHSFGRVIWMDPSEGHSDAFEAFLALVGDQLLTACHDLGVEIREDVLRTIDSLQDMMVAPMRLLEAMRHSPLNPNLAASESYVALRAQLFAELPTYLKLLDRGMAVCILNLAHVQQRFYNEIRDRWAEMWDCVEVDRHANQGLEETLQVWLRRYGAVKAQVMSLNISRRPGERPMAAKQWMEPDERYTTGGQTTLMSTRFAAIIAARERFRPRVPTRAIPPLPPPLPSYVYPGFSGSWLRNTHDWMESNDGSASSEESGEPGGLSSSSPQRSIAMIPSESYIVPEFAHPRTELPNLARPRRSLSHIRTYPTGMGEWIIPGNSNRNLNSLLGIVRRNGYEIMNASFLLYPCLELQLTPNRWLTSYKLGSLVSSPLKSMFYDLVDLCISNTENTFQVHQVSTTGVRRRSASYWSFSPPNCGGGRSC